MLTFFPSQSHCRTLRSGVWRPRLHSRQNIWEASHRVPTRVVWKPTVISAKPMNEENMEMISMNWGDSNSRSCPWSIVMYMYIVQFMLQMFCHWNLIMQQKQQQHEQEQQQHEPWQQSCLSSLGLRHLGTKCKAHSQQTQKRCDADDGGALMQCSSFILCHVWWKYGEYNPESWCIKQINLW